MKVKLFTVLMIGVVTGYLIALLMLDTVPPQPTATVDNSDSQDIQQQVATLRAQEKQLKAQLAQTQKQLQTFKTSLSEGAELSLQEEIQLETEALFQQAETALLQGDLATATQLYNLLLNSADSKAERERAIDGLVDLSRAIHDFYMSTGGDVDSALWQLFEIHKLKPSDTLRTEMMQRSNEAWQAAQQYRADGELAAAADHLTALVHISNMVDFTVDNNSGVSLSTEDLQQELDQVEQEPAYLDQLADRATYKLHSGHELEQAFVFWDYSKIATIGGKEIRKDNNFQEEFVQASVYHLDHLKRMNMEGEIKSRLDYIRYSFPELMADERLYNYH